MLCCISNHLSAPFLPAECRLVDHNHLPLLLTFRPQRLVASAWPTSIAIVVSAVRCDAKYSQNVFHPSFPLLLDQIDRLAPVPYSRKRWKNGPGQME